MREGARPAVGRPRLADNLWRPSARAA